MDRRRLLMALAATLGIAGFAAAQEKPPASAKDPVCGMDVDPKDADTKTTKQEGKTYYFCSEACKKKFEADPKKYTAKK